jgi:DNA-binding XRE family transcriptional regulator
MTGLTESQVLQMAKATLDQIERERVEHNMEILRTAAPAILFRLRDAAKIMESCGYVLDPLAESSLFEYAIKQRGGEGR